MSGQDRLRGLDVLRAVAVLLVLGRHLGPVTDRPAEAFAWAVRPWMAAGWVGVDLFFVLSGFLVSGLVFRERQRTGAFRPWRFLVRRGLKIYPGFYAMLALSAAMLAALGLRVPWERLVWDAVFLTSYVQGLWPHTWSLAVEEHFYLLLALTLAALGRRSGDRPFAPVVPFALLALAACLAGRWLAWSDQPFESWAVISPTHLRLDALLFGVALSHAWHHGPAGFDSIARSRPGLTIVSGALLLLPAASTDLERDRFAATLGLTLVTLGSGLLILGALHAPSRLERLTGLLARLGAHSYGIYLWHLPVGLLTHQAFARLHLPGGLLAESLVYLVGSCVVGIGASLLVEQPALRLRDRWFPSRSGSPTTASVGGPPGPDDARSVGGVAGAP